jgi:serine/threonine protein phosphatase PrpC
MTEDHSWVQEQVSRGAMTREEAETSPFRNVITRSLGAAPEVEPDLFAIKLEPGDRVLLCSDGLSGMVDDGELFEIAREGSASVAAWNLVDRAVENGGRDNVTVLVLDAQAIEPWVDATGRQGEGETGLKGEMAREEVEAGEHHSPSARAVAASEIRPLSPSPHRPLSPSPRRGVRAIMKGLLGR